MDIGLLRALQRDEYRDFAELVGTLSVDQWRSPSLCRGWTVGQVVAHVVAWDELLVFDGVGDYTGGIVTLLSRFVRAGFSLERMNEGLLRRARVDHDELARALASCDGGSRRIFDRVATGSALAEAVIHHQDIRRPLGLGRVIPAARLVAALDCIGAVPGIPVKKRASGVHLRATDLDWSMGTGPDIHGPAEALLMSLAGRAGALGDLTGEGVPTLAVRLAA